MKISIRKQRGRPIYIQYGRGTISLVPEVRVLEVALGVGSRPIVHRVAPYAVYVIDDQGVRRVRIADMGMRILGILVASTMLWVFPLLFWAGRKALGRRAGTR
jgi:hypothetical protein